MSTLVAMVSTGQRESLTDVSFPRLARWASRHDYSAILIKERLEDEDRVPHYAKLLVARRFPGFDTYAVIDDDLLMSSNAPALPEVPDGYVGMAKDAEQENTKNPDVLWTGNSGFVVFGRNANELLLEAYAKGDDVSIWPRFADQTALNSVLWSRQRIVEIDWRWNFPPVVKFFLDGRGWPAWLKSRLYRLSYYTRVAINPFSPERQALRACWGCHLIRAPYPRFFDRFLP